MRRLLATLVLVPAIVTGTTVGLNHAPSREDLHIHSQATSTLTLSTTTGTTAVIRTPPPVPVLQKRDFAYTCGVVSGTSLGCYLAQGVCVWAPGSGPVGCCPVDRSGYAYDSCAPPTTCVPYGAWFLYHSTRVPDPETVYCTNIARPYCQEQILRGFVTRPNGLIEPGAWTAFECGTATTTAYGSIWTDESNVNADPDFALLSQNMKMYPAQGGLIVKRGFDWVGGSVPQPADKVIANLPPPQKDLFDTELTGFQEKNPNAIVLGAKRGNVELIRARLQPRFTSALWAQNMRMYAGEGDPVINFDHDPIRLDPDERELANSLFYYFRPSFLEFSSDIIHRRQDTEPTTDDEVPEILLLLNLYQLIALNLDYFSAARDIDTYLGALEVVPVTVTVPDGGFVPGFTTVMLVTSIPTMRAATQTSEDTANPTASAAEASQTSSAAEASQTSSAAEASQTSIAAEASQTSSAVEASQTCSNGRVIPITIKCDGAVVTVSARLLWSVCLAMAVLVVVPAFAGVV